MIQLPEPPKPLKTIMSLLAAIIITWVLIKGLIFFKLIPSTFSFTTQEALSQMMVKDASKNQFPELYKFVNNKDVQEAATKFDGVNQNVLNTESVFKTKSLIQNSGLKQVKTVSGKEFLDLVGEEYIKKIADDRITVSGIEDYNVTIAKDFGDKLTVLEFQKGDLYKGELITAFMVPNENVPFFTVKKWDTPLYIRGTENGVAIMTLRLVDDMEKYNFDNDDIKYIHIFNGNVKDGFQEASFHGAKATVVFHENGYYIYNHLSDNLYDMSLSGSMKNHFFNVGIYDSNLGGKTFVFNSFDKYLFFLDQKKGVVHFYKNGNKLSEIPLVSPLIGSNFDKISFCELDVYTCLNVFNNDKLVGQIRLEAASQFNIEAGKIFVLNKDGIRAYDYTQNNGIGPSEYASVSENTIPKTNIPYYTTKKVSGEKSLTFVH